MSETEIVKVEDIQAPDPMTSFSDDVNIICEQTANFVNKFYPCYAYDRETTLMKAIESNSLAVLNNLNFYKISECTIDDVDDKIRFFSNKIQKLFMTMYSMNMSICYGVVGYEGKNNLVIGVKSNDEEIVTKKVIEGLLPGMKLENINEPFKNKSGIKDKALGLINGTPALNVEGQMLDKNISTIIKSLNGENYTLLFMCKPIANLEIQNLINSAIDIRDKCTAISKRNVTRQYSESNSNTDTTSHSDTETNSETDSKTTTRSNSLNVNLGVPGILSGAMIGAAMGTPVPIIGNALGAIGGGMIGLIVGQQFSGSHSKSKSKTQSKTHGTSITESYSNSISKSISEGGSVALDIQNGYAIELMQLAENAIERFKIGSNIGLWQTTISYSADKEMARNIIQGCLYSEIASAQKEILPPYSIATTSSELSELNEQKGIQGIQHLIIPKDFFEDNIVQSTPLCSWINTEELSGVCTIPIENVPGFEIKKSKSYPLVDVISSDGKGIVLGNVCEYERVLDNLQFELSESDLNKHTFVCGITGSGKTNTVKHILSHCKKPFLVIEPAKKEYRNIEVENGVQVFTLGKPELNSVRINPFYILPGVSPQQHIDFLKDLFNASFSFYGPMPYIVEKCLHNIYLKKGWDLTLGYHPALVNKNNLLEFFDLETIMKQYKKKAHKYLFPTMQDLKDEVDRYIQDEMEYDGEVRGNIKSAIKARIDSLCIDAKGYMFNTYEMLDYEDILSKNCVMELEGLADDADKAFALGLLIIGITEYRQIYKEAETAGKLKLNHLLVVEEAHRLLKNVETERNSETIGNPKGKAVEHFTNMIAEMRSYGQGVIVAEQIPSKLAPDVIKNSSNKIIHRIVAKDDQEIVANMICISEEDSIYLGNNITGYALCHKEGMALPVYVKIPEITKGNVSDETLYKKNLNRKALEISKSIIKNVMPNYISEAGIQIINMVLLYSDYNKVYKGIELIGKRIKRKLQLAHASIIPAIDFDTIIFSLLTDEIEILITRGIYSKNVLIEDKEKSIIEKALSSGQDEILSKLRSFLQEYYKKDCVQVALDVMAELVFEAYLLGEDVEKQVNTYLVIPDKFVAQKVVDKLSVRRKEYGF